MRRLLSEPLVGFGLVGLLLFACFEWVTGPATQEIVVTDAVRTRISGDWQAQMGQAPTDEQLENLVTRWVEDEMVYREAKRLSLDQGDDIVRRRLVQKMRFVVEDEGMGAPPGEDALRGFFAANGERYREPPRVSFEHRFFSADSRQDPAGDVSAMLASGDPGDGDPFLLDRSFTRASKPVVVRHFGETFGAALFDLPASATWQGPVESAYGQHAVRIREQIEAQLPPFDQAAASVLADYEAERRASAHAAFMAGLRARYAVAR